MVFTLPGMMVRCTVPSFSISTSDIWPPPPLFHPVLSPPPQAFLQHNNRLQEYRYSTVTKEALRYDLPISAPLHPHPERKDIFLFLQPLPPFLFLILLPFRCTLSARRPASSSDLPPRRQKSASPALGALQAIPLPLSFLHMIIASFPSITTMSDRQTTTTPETPSSSFQHAGRRHQI